MNSDRNRKKPDTNFGNLRESEDATGEIRDHLRNSRQSVLLSVIIRVRPWFQSDRSNFVNPDCPQSVFLVSLSLLCVLTPLRLCDEFPLNGF
jgi:hypothetical protein